MEDLFFINIEETELDMRRKKFKTANEFSIHIEKLAKEYNLPVMDVLVDYCQKEEIEFESVSSMISTSLKDKLQAEAIRLHLIKGSNERLPI